MVFHMTEKLSRKVHLFKCFQEYAEMRCQRSGTMTFFKLSSGETRVGLLFIFYNDIQEYRNYLLLKVAEKSNSLRNYFFSLWFFFFFHQEQSSFSRLYFFPFFCVSITHFWILLLYIERICRYLRKV